MTARDVIAGVLGEHRFYWDGWFLNCPSCPDWRGRCDYDKELHRADALIAAGVTMPAERAMQMVCAAMNSGRTDAEKLSRIEVVVAAWVDRPESLTPTATIEGLARGDHGRVGAVAGGGAMTPSADPSLFDRLCDIIEGQNVSEWQGGIHPEDVGHLARALIAAGVTMPAPPEFDGRCQQPVAARGSRPCVLDIGHDGGCF